MIRPIIALFAAIGLFLASVAPVRAQQTPHSIAIFVKNHADNVNDDKVAVFEDLITGHLSDAGFRIISRDDVLNAVSGFSTEGANKGGASDVDAILSKDSSALRLAQNLNADCLLVCSITTYTDDQTTYDDNDAGIHTTIDEYKMEISYRLLDAVQGGSATGGVVEVSKKDRAEPGHTTTRDYVKLLLSDASDKLAQILSDKFNRGAVGPIAVGTDRLVTFNVTCSNSDLNVPVVEQNDQGEYSIAASKYQVDAMNVTVLVDGISVGTTPGPFQASPGLHVVRLTRDGFKDWQQRVNVRDGLSLNVALEFTDDGLARWRDTTAFLNNLTNTTKLTDADVERIKGIAQMYAQSGYRVDWRSTSTNDSHSNINSNTGYNLVNLAVPPGQTVYNNNNNNNNAPATQPATTAPSK